MYLSLQADFFANAFLHEAAASYRVNQRFRRPDERFQPVGIRDETCAGHFHKCGLYPFEGSLHLHLMSVMEKNLAAPPGKYNGP